MEELAILILQLAIKAAPIIEAKIKAGEVSTDEQQQIRDAYLTYRAAMDRLFDGSEWEQSQPENEPSTFSEASPLNQPQPSPLP